MAEFNLMVPSFLLDYRSVTLYQEWLNLGNEGTMADFIAWLRTPATEAAGIALQAAATANVAIQEMATALQEADDTAAVWAAAEAGRASAESGRVTAETGRTTAEGLRVTAETTRGATEMGRQTAETARTSAESLRATAETGRTTAESVRASAESGRVTAETGRATAETARVAAENARNVASNVYNVTVSVPLSAGQFYTLATAIAAVVVELRKKGLTITFESSDGVWRTYQFAGTTTATWTTVGNWIESQTNKAEITELLGLPLSGALIDMKPGEYLSDIIQNITGVTLENPVTINFYNHSKTVNWATFTEKIHWPEHVHLNFVGKINLWPNSYYPGISFDEGLLSANPTDKLFLGFSFDRTNDDSSIRISGLPFELQKLFFGGLDQSYQIAESYQDLIDTPEDWGEAEFGLVRVNGSKEDDVRNDALYKKIDGVFVDVTPDFRFVDFSGCDMSLAYFYSANNQGANFGSANNQGAYFGYANNQGANFGYANNQGANFSYANNQGAYFGSANNQGAYFYSANNQGAYFNYANNQGANFGYANNQNANFNLANNQNAYFDYANLKNVNWDSVISIESANFQNADLTGGINLPERINTKAKWIAECGAGNVNAATIWIDGTSILS